MQSLHRLLKISDILLGPSGCPWDRKQTLDTLKIFLLEEMHELLEAIDLKEIEQIREELGDVFYVLIFLAKLAERNKFFTLEEVFNMTAEKLIRRHPHVFGEEKAESNDEILKIWEEAKKKEGKKSPFSGIPSTLPALSRAQKVAHKLKMRGEGRPAASLQGEEELGNLLWEIVQEAEAQNLDAESALRKKTHEILSDTIHRK